VPNRLIFHPQSGIENPRVGGSIPALGTTKFHKNDAWPRVAIIAGQAGILSCVLFG